MNNSAPSPSTSGHNVLILKVTPHSITDAEEFLTSQSFQVYSSYVLQEFLGLVSQKKPDVILLPADYPDKNIKLLVELLNKLVGVPILGYTENPSSKSAKKLADLELSNPIFPPITGPALEKAILISLGLNKPDKNENANDIQIIHGDINFKEEMDHLTSDPVDEKSDLMIQKGQRNKFLSINKGTPEEKGFFFNKGSPPKKQGYVPGQSSPPDESSDEKKAPPTTSPQNKSTLIHQSNESFKQAVTGSFNDKGTEDGGSLILKGTQEALEQIIIKSDPSIPAQEISKTISNVSCFTVQSPKISGYLVAAMGNNEKISLSFIELVRQRLFQYLIKNGELVEDNSSLMDLQLEPVDFQDWAISEGEFLRKSIHENNEVALAFFPSSNTKISWEPSPNEDMIQVTLDNIKEDAPLDFDLYVYLPSNNKFILYTPEGGSLFANQKSRLQERGITHLHLKKESSEKLTPYKARVTLSEEIERYRKKK